VRKWVALEPAGRIASWPRKTLSPTEAAPVRSARTTRPACRRAARCYLPSVAELW